MSLIKISVIFGIKELFSWCFDFQRQYKMAAKIFMVYLQLHSDYGKQITSNRSAVIHLCALALAHRWIVFVVGCELISWNARVVSLLINIFHTFLLSEMLNCAKVGSRWNIGFYFTENLSIHGYICTKAKLFFKLALNIHQPK